jgi:predicted ABC-type ATPase
MIAARVQREVTARKMNAVLDATGDHSLEKARSKIQRVKDAGYKINGVYTTIDIEEAKKRAKARGDKTGRYIPDDFLQHAHQTVAAIVPEVVDMFDDFVLYDTTEKPPKLLFSNHGGTMQIEDQDGYTAFLQRGKTS